MNCDQLKKITGWHCSPSGTRSVRLTSPLHLGDDGQHVAFYIAQPDDQTFYLTDVGESAMHASSFGVDISKSRLDILNATHGVQYATIGKDGAITARGPIADAEIALWDAVKLAMSVSFNSKKWSPKLDQVRFRALVEKVLLEQVGKKRLLKAIKIKGLSGHTVEFPFAIKSSNETIFYIEPIALANGSVDWQHVYQVHGKLSDVKQADEQGKRLVIFEDGAPAMEFGRAATLLSQCASIQTLSQAKEWLKAA